MSKRKRGVSLEEKRERILQIYHESKQVFNLKEIEKLGAKAGVVLQTIKDVNQALVDDALVDSDKIGSGNYFWSFPSKLSQQKRAKLHQLQSQSDQLRHKLEKLQQEIEQEQHVRQENPLRVDNLQQVAQLETKCRDLQQKLHLAQENDPQMLEQLQLKVKLAKEGADRWTDNLFALKSWVVQKRNCPSAEVDKWLGIKEDFDYVE